MGSESRLSVPERREVVLSLLRRQEPATVRARRYGISENTLYRWRPFSSGCRSDRYGPESSRINTPRLFAAKEHRFVYGQEPHTKSKKYFPLELRANTRRCPHWVYDWAEKHRKRRDFWQRIVRNIPTCSP